VNKKLIFIGYNLTENDLNSTSLVSGEIKNANYLMRALKNLNVDLVPISINLYGESDPSLISINKSNAKGVSRWLVEGVGLNKVISEVLTNDSIIYLTIPSYLPFLKIPDGVKVIVTAHGTYWPELIADLKYEKNIIKRLAHLINGKLQLEIDKLSFKKADYLHSVSEYQVSEMINTYKVPNEKIVSIRNGTDFVTKNSKRVYDFIWVGRLAKKKNLSLFLDFVNLYPDSKVCISAGNEYFAIDESSKSLIEFSKKSPNIDVFSNISDSHLCDLMNSSKTLIVSSTGYESIPTVIFEGLACGCIVLAPDSWGVNEVEGKGLVTYSEGSLCSLIDKYKGIDEVTGSVGASVSWDCRAKKFKEAFNL
jgi:glycosyltransferase involved in cell wall biosynthesis